MIQKTFFLALASILTIYGDWSQPPIDVSLTGQNATDVHVATDPNGNAVATWSRSDGSGPRIQASKYTASSNTWSTPEYLSDTGGTAISNDVGIDSSGNAIAIWTRFDGSDFIAQTKRCVSGTWDVTATELSATGQDALEPGIAVDSAGDAVAIWTYTTGVYTIIQTSEFSGGSWTSLPDFTDASGPLTSPKISRDFVTGNAVAIYLASTFGTLKVRATIYTKSTTSWGAVQEISLIDAVAKFHLALDMGPTGVAVAAWTRDESPTIIKTSVYNGSSWSTPPTSIPLALATDAQLPDVGVDSSGNAVLIWQQNVVLATFNIYSSSFNGTTWSATPVLISDVGVDSKRSSVTAGSTGSAVAVWESLDTSGDRYIQSASYEGGVWSSTSDLTLPFSSAFEPTPQVSMNLSGAAIAAWIGTDGSNGIVQASALTLSPPTDFVGKVVNNKFVTQTEIVHVLSWTAPTDPSIIGYRVYESGKLIEQVPKTGPFEVFVHNRKKGKTYFYSLVSFNESGTESTPVFLQLP